MKIKKIINQHRRDFTAIMVCEHCNIETENDCGYDDTNYHQNVIPAMVCEYCNRTSDGNYVPQATKYAMHEVI